MQIGQRLAVGERRDLRHDLSKEIERAVGFRHVGVQLVPPVPLLLVFAGIDQRTLSARHLIDRRHI